MCLFVGTHVPYCIRSLKIKDWDKMMKTVKQLGSLASVVQNVGESGLYLQLPNMDLIKLEGENFGREKVRDSFVELESTFYEGKTIILAERNAIKYLLVYQDDVENGTKVLELVESVEDGTTFVLSKDGKHIAVVPFSVEKLGVIQGNKINAMSAEVIDELD